MPATQRDKFKINTFQDANSATLRSYSKILLNCKSATQISETHPVLKMIFSVCDLASEGSTAAQVSQNSMV